MFKCVFIIIFLYLHIQTITTQSRSFSKRMIYRRYKNPYKIDSRQNTLSSGYQIPPFYFFKNGELKVGGVGEDHKNVQNDQQVPSLQFNQKVTTLKVATLLRNNLIKVFGYILHRPEMELNSQLYTSLYFILNTIKLNQVNILSMVPILEDIAFRSSNDRFLKIFEAMETHLPIYLACAATFWKEEIQAEHVNLNHILKPYANGPLIVDVMEGMNAEMLSMVKIDDKIDSLNDEEQKVSYNFNRNIAEIMRHIEEQKNNIPQIFIGALVLYFPRNAIQPDLEESIQVLAEYLEQNKIEDWQGYVSALEGTQVTDPYLMVKFVLNKLIQNSDVSVVIKESIQIILSSIGNRNPTAINPNYNSIANLVTLKEIKITYMLQYITAPVYPEEIIISRRRLVYYLKHNYIRPLTLLVNFNPYYYSSPTEILIAILNRLIKRQPDLPPEILDSAGAVYSYLTFAFRYSSFPSVLADDLLNPNIIFMSLRAPDIERSIVTTVDTIVSMLDIPGLSYQQILLERAVQKCATPSYCFFDLLTFVEDYFPSPELLPLLNILFQSSCCIGKCPLQPPPKSNETSLFPRIFLNQSDSDAIMNTSTDYVTTVQTIPPPSEGPILVPSTLRATAATPPTTVSVDGGIPPEVTQSMPSNSTAILDLVEHMSSRYRDKLHVRELLRILNSEKYKAEFEDLKKETRTVFITGIIIYLEKMKNGEDFGSAVREYLEIFFVELKRIESIVKEITTEKLPTQPVLSQLIVAVPAPMDNETEIFHQFSLLLQKDDLFTLIADNIENKSYNNIATLLNAVLIEEIKLTDTLSAEELKAAKYYVNKIQKYGFGQGKISWGVNIDVISQNIDIAQVMDNALGYKSLGKIKQWQFNSIITYLKANPPILQQWDKWIYYTKCGDFTKALFSMLLRKGSLPVSIRKAVRYLMNHIKYHGNGLKPTFE